MNDLKSQKEVFVHRFPLLILSKNNDTVIKLVDVKGIKNNLSARSSHTSPIRKNSRYFLEDKYNLSMLKDSNFRLTLVDIPIITMLPEDVIDNKLLFCALIEDNPQQLSLIKYAEIKMSQTLRMLFTSSPNLTSEKDIEVFVSLKSSKTPFINESMFCFLSHSIDKKTIKMSSYMKIQSWSQEHKNSVKKKRMEELSPIPSINKEELYDNILTTVTQMKDDFDFLKRMDNFIQNDKVKNKKITRDEYLNINNDDDDDDE